jgi:hypothetical protein
LADRWLQEGYNNAASEKMPEIDMTGNKAVKAGNQFGWEFAVSLFIFIDARCE